MGYSKTHSEFPCKWRCCHVCSGNKYDCHVVWLLAGNWR